MRRGHKWQFNIGYHYARARMEGLPQLPRVYNYEQWRIAENYILLNLVLHFVEKYNIYLQTTTTAGCSNYKQSCSITGKARH